MYAIYATHPQKVRMYAHTQDPPGGGLCGWLEKRGGGCLDGGPKMCHGENFCSTQKKSKKVLGQLAEERRCIIKCLRRWWVFRHGIILPG